jgi:hypothetical protein
MRKLWIASLALTVGAGVAAAAAPALAVSASASPHQQARVVLPVPSGRYPVGTVSLELTDHSRVNPWTPSPRYRELMVSIWYPATDTRCYPRAPQMLPGAAAHFGEAKGVAQLLYNIPPGSVDWAATLTSGHELAPVASHHAPFPVVLYSPLDLTLKGASNEDSYKDAVPLIPQIARQLGLPHSFVVKEIGTINPAQAVTAEEAYVAAFFDRWLRGKNNHLLDRPSPRYPQIAFIR